MTGPEITHSGGWCAPSDHVCDAPEGDFENIRSLPAFSVPRGGMKFGEVAIPTRPVKPRPERDPRGHWEFGADITDYSEGDTETEIMSSGSAWHDEPYLTAEEAARDWPEGRIVKRWVPAPSPWQEEK